MNLSAATAALVPTGVTTVTSCTPVPAGAVAVTWVAELTVKLVALVAPKRTAVAPVKVTPVIVTTVPPAVEPEAGLIPVTAGAPPAGPTRTPATSTASMLM